MRSCAWRIRGVLGVGLMMLLAAPAGAQPGQQKPTEPAPIAGQPPAVPEKSAPPGAGEVVGGVAAPTPTPASATAPAAAASDPLSPTRLMDGPSLRETGRIAMPATASMGMIEGQGELKSPSEKSITPAASSLGTAQVPRRTGVIPPRILEREIAEHFTEIGGCRVEVARVKQVTPPQVVADKLLLRWIIEPDGSIGATDVVAVSPVDLAVMDCAKRVMSQWKFTAPRGGSMMVERDYAF
jgi:hypothetical protein